VENVSREKDICILNIYFRLETQVNWKMFEQSSKAFGAKQSKLMFFNTLAKVNGNSEK
jgi:hypothetical protein